MRIRAFHSLSFLLFIGLGCGGDTVCVVPSHISGLPAHCYEDWSEEECKSTADNVDVGYQFTTGKTCADLGHERECDPGHWQKSCR